MKKISISVTLAALLMYGCSDKPKEEESSVATTTKQESAVAKTTTQASNQNLYGVSAESTQQQTETSNKDVQVGTKHVATVVETMNAANYTYAKVDEDGNVYWIAGPQTTIAIGNKISFIDQMVMEDFTSKALDKTFEYLVFASTIISVDKAGSSAVAAKKEEHDCDSCGPDGKPKIQASAPVSHAKPKTTQIESIKVAKIAGGYNIEELYAKKADLNGTTVKVNAKVVKVSRNIMKKDWVHLQDGSGSGTTSDIVVTTTNANVNVGDVVTTEAILNTDVDFGYGYFFALILQEAKFTPVK